MGVRKGTVVSFVPTLFGYFLEIPSLYKCFCGTCTAEMTFYPVKNSEKTCSFLSYYTIMVAKRQTGLRN